MVTQITKGIKISVDTEFQGTYYKDTNLLYAFEYSISIENQSSDVVQLNSRPVSYTHLTLPTTGSV